MSVCILIHAKSSVVAKNLKDFLENFLTDKVDIKLANKSNLSLYKQEEDTLGIFFIDNNLTIKEVESYRLKHYIIVSECSKVDSGLTNNITYMKAPVRLDSLLDNVRKIIKLF